MTTVTSTKIGTDAMIRTSQSVSIGPAWVDDAGGNQSIRRPATMPRADATSPTTTICIAVRFGSLRSAGATSCVSCGLSSWAMGAASYGSPAMDDNAVVPTFARRPAEAARMPSGAAQAAARWGAGRATSS